MSDSPRILTGLHEIAEGHDALVCDVWGVIHNSVIVYSAATDALVRFRKERGPVILLTNAPRPADAVLQQFAKLGVPTDCYDVIVTSGGAARADLAARAGSARLPIFHLGPERDRGVFEGLAVDCVEIAAARIVLCTGLFDNNTESPDNYRDMLAEMKARGLALLCANPDIVVQVGGNLVYCAGAIARVYQEMGGEVVYYGKPHAPIYRTVLAEARKAAGHEIKKPLAIGDGLETDMRGALGQGMDTLFVADGIHGEEIGELTPQSLAKLYAKAGLAPKAAIRTLVW